MGYEMPYYGQQYQPRGMNANMNPTMMQATQSGYSVRPVGSREEAVGAQVDFVSPGMIMPDLSHGIIYFKRFNAEMGSTEFHTFKLATPEPPPQYATLADLEALKAELTAKKAARRKDDAE